MVSPKTLKTRPKVSLPTGTEIGRPVSNTSKPRVKPSVDDIVRFEEEFHAFFDAQHPEILETIRETKDLPEEAVLDAAITEFLNQSSFQ